ncbi:hypothetical protein [Tabrizicola soli]|uniref:Uncharacterized protein n=1 Tax=Tabrizicola soli TaxID=2185115 RepID=A0ABV7DTN0_9RHOB|nr:hypothetical protein [Tabrizicola soli]
MRDRVPTETPELAGSLRFGRPDKVNEALADLLAHSRDIAALALTVPPDDGACAQRADVGAVATRWTPEPLEQRLHEQEFQAIPISVAAFLLAVLAFRRGGQGCASLPRRWGERTAPDPLHEAGKVDHRDAGF